MNDFFAVTAGATPPAIASTAQCAAAVDIDTAAQEFAECLASSLVDQQGTGQQGSEAPVSPSDIDVQAPVSSEAEVAPGIVADFEAEVEPRAEVMAATLPIASEQPPMVGASTISSHQLQDVHSDEGSASEGIIGAGKTMPLRDAETADISSQLIDESGALDGATETAQASGSSSGKPQVTQTGTPQSPDKLISLHMAVGSDHATAAHAMASPESKPVKASSLGELVSGTATAMEVLSLARSGSTSSDKFGSGSAETPQPSPMENSQVKAQLKIDQQFAAQIERLEGKTIDVPAGKTNAGPIGEAVTAASVATTAGTPSTVNALASLPAQSTAQTPVQPPVNPVSTQVQPGPTYPFNVVSQAGLKGEAMRLVGELKAAGKGASEATLLLHPKNLGSVHVRMELTGDKIVASMMVETRGAEQAMQAALPQLDQAFRSQGFTEVRMLVANGNPEHSWSQQANSGNGQPGSQPKQQNAAPEFLGSVADSPENRGRMDLSGISSGKLNIVV